MDFEKAPLPPRLVDRPAIVAKAEPPLPPPAGPISYAKLLELVKAADGAPVRVAAGAVEPEPGDVVVRSIPQYVAGRYVCWLDGDGRFVMNGLDTRNVAVPAVAAPTFPVHHKGHDCPECGRERNPTPTFQEWRGGHSHKCPWCSTVWWH